MENNSVYDSNNSNQAPTPIPTTTNNSSNQDYVEESNGLKNKVIKIFKILLPVVLIIIVAIAVFYYILPRFRSGGSGQEVEIIYWGLYEPESIMSTVIEDFEKENPKIKVKYELKDLKGYKTTLITRINNGTGPDIYRFHNSWTPVISDNLSALPNTVVSKDELEKDYFPTVARDVIVNGAILGVPIHMDTLTMFINKEIFDNAGVGVPETWEEFIDIATGLTVKDEDDAIKTSGSSIGTFDNILHASDLVSLMFLQNAVKMEDPSESVDEMSEALRFYTNFSTGRDNIGIIWDQSKNNSINEFSAGNVAMYFGYSWDIFEILAQNPDIKIETYPVPRLSKKSMTISSYWVEGVSSKSKYKKESMIFLEFLARRETQERLFTEQSKTRLFGELPARRDLAELLKENKLVYTFVSQAENSYSTYFSSNTQDESFNDELNQYLNNAVNSILSGTSAQTASETLAQGISEVLKKYGLK